MKKIFLFLLVGFFAVVVAACSQLPTLESIELSGQDVEFYVGEEFNTGDLKVVAKLSDASTEDVTAQATVSQEADMSKAGTYTVIVSYKGLTQSYEIKVVDDKVVSLEAENLKAEYKIGETVSFEGAIAKETYESGKVADADLASYEVVLVAAGKEYTGAFAKVGENTVKLVKGECVYEYKVNVSANLYTSIADAVAAGVKNADNVASGAAVIDNDGYLNEIAYEFGKNYTYVSSVDGTYYYNLLEDETMFGLYKYISFDETEVLELAYEPIVEYLAGADFRSVFSYAYDVYGVEALVDTFAYMGQSENAVNYKELVPAELSEKMVYAFSYEIFMENNYYFVTVEFELDANTEAIKDVNVLMKGYYGVLNEETWVYEVPTEFAETPDFTRVITASQVLGEQVAENPYSLDEIFVNSFELLDSEGNTAATEYTVKAGESILLTLANVLPNTAILTVNPVNIEYNDYDWTLGSDVYEGVITITPNAARTYVITISCGNATKEIIVTATQPSPESMITYVGEYVEGWWGGGYELVEGNVAETEVGQSLYVSAEVYPSKAEQAYSYALKEATENATIGESDPSDWSIPYGALTFSASVPGTYVIVFTSEVDPTITGEITVTVTESTKEPVTLDGTWISSFTNPRTGMVLPFTLVLNLDGTGNLNCYNSEFVEFTYAVDGNAIAYTVTNGWTGSLDGCSFDLNNGTMALTISTEDYGYYPLTFEKEVEGEEEATLVGEWSGTFPHPLNPMLPCNVTMTFFENGTGSGVFNGTPATFEYSDNGDSVSFTNVSSVDVTFTIGTYTDGYAELTLFVNVNGTMVQATLTK